MVRANIAGVFCTYKRLHDGTRKTYWYHRATGQRLGGQPGSAEFIADLARAEEFMKSRLNGDNFIGLVRAYTLSIEFETKLASSTQAEYRRMLAKAEAKFGSMPIQVLEDPRINRDFLQWREEVARASGEREGDNRLSAISTMLTWSKEHGRITVNHLKGFRRLYHADRSEKIWLPEHIEAFMKVAPIELQRALIIALHTGQRQGDIIKLVWTSYDGVSLTVRQGKSRRRGVQGPLVTIPCTRALRAVLDGIPRVSTLILATKTGQPFKKRYFAELWDRATKAAGVTDLHFHDLRGTAITMLSEAGNTPQQIAPITGHSLKTITVILDRYLARTRALADQAIFNFENSPRTEFANRLQTSVASRMANRQKANE
jgi:integrase